MLLLMLTLEMVAWIRLSECASVSVCDADVWAISLPFVYFFLSLVISMIYWMCWHPLLIKIIIHLLNTPRAAYGWMHTYLVRSLFLSILLANQPTNQPSIQLDIHICVHSVLVSVLVFSYALSLSLAVSFPPSSLSLHFFVGFHRKDFLRTILMVPMFTFCLFRFKNSNPFVSVVSMFRDIAYYISFSLSPIFLLLFFCLFFSASASTSL